MFELPQGQFLLTSSFPMYQSYFIFLHMWQRLFLLEPGNFKYYVGHLQIRFFSKPLPVFGIVHVLDFGHSNKCGLASHFYFSGVSKLIE